MTAAKIPASFDALDAAVRSRQTPFLTALVASVQRALESGDSAATELTLSNLRTELAAYRLGDLVLLASAVADELEVSNEPA